MITIARKLDGEIQQEVIRELRWDCRTEHSPVMVAVKNGVVTLTGRVKYYAVKHAAEQAAHRIAGVESVTNDLLVKIPADEYRADCEVADEVRHAFAWNVLVPDSSLSVLVEAGIVTLYGTVDCISQREEAENCVINLLGVRGIENKIAVRIQSVEAGTVCAGIVDSLMRQSVATAEQVSVEVDHADVRLTGTVPTWNHRQAVVTAAGFAHGIRRVVDALDVAVA